MTLCTSRIRTLGAACSLAACLTAAAQQQGAAWRVETDAAGARLVRADAPPAGPAFGARDVLWTYSNDFAAITQSVAFQPTASLLWAGQALNGERVQGFAVPGDGTPSLDFPANTDSPAAVAASAATDRAAFIDGVEGAGPYYVRGLTSAGPTWEFEVPPPYGFSYAGRQIKVSRDGTTVAVGMSYYDQNTQTSASRVYALDAATGLVKSVWDGAGGVTAVDLNDDGSRCLVTNDAVGRLLDMSAATGVQTFSASASGAGGWFVLSGNANTLVVGGFNLAVWVNNNGTWTRRILFQGPNQWFGWGLAVSRDGNTVACISHDYANGYLDTYTRAWDVPSRALLGTYHTTGSGLYQDSAQGGRIAEDGSTFAVCSWGAQDNNHPEVMIFDRTVHLLGGIDTAGSVFALAMTPDGRFTASGSKAAHANEFGNGGDVSLYDGNPGDPGCPADFNDDEFVDFFDYADYVACFETGACPPGKTADFNGDAFVDFFDYLDFTAAFEAGC